MKKDDISKAANRVVYFDPLQHPFRSRPQHCEARLIQLPIRFHFVSHFSFGIGGRSVCSEHYNSAASVVFGIERTIWWCELGLPLPKFGSLTGSCLHASDTFDHR